MIIRSLVCAAQMTFPDISGCARRTARQPPAVGGDYKWDGQPCGFPRAAAVHIHSHGANSFTLPPPPMSLQLTILLHVNRDYIS